MAVTKTFAGSSFNLPLNREPKSSSWGTEVSNFLIALADNAIPKTGGAYTLSAELNLGATYGLLAPYLKSAGTNIASTGVVRLAKTETIGFRNNANDGDLALAINGSDQLTFNGVRLATAGAASIVNADISASAAIAYSKLNLAGAVQNSDLAGSIAYSKLALTGAILNADLAGSITYSKLSLSAGDIPYSKLTLTGSVVNADVSSSAAIAYSKLSLAASIATTDLASGLLVPTGKGGTGVTSVTTSPTASSFAGWDGNKNLSANAHLDAFSTTATAAGTTTLTVSSTRWQVFTGSTTQTVVLPVASTLATGQSFKVVNQSTGVVTVQSSGGNTVQAMAASSYAEFVCVLTSGTTAASWAVNYSVNNAGGGTVTQVTTSAPLAVSSGTTTPALSITNGTNGQVLQSGASTPAFAWPHTTAAKSADYTITDSDGFEVILVTTGASTRTITLPAAANNTNRLLTVKKVDSGAGKVTISRAGSDTIDGYTSTDIGSGGVSSAGAANQWSYMSLVSDGTNWRVVACGGDDIFGSIARSSATSLSTGTAKTVTSISIPPGTWDVVGAVGLTFTGATTTQMDAALSTTTNSLPASSTICNPDTSGQVRMTYNSPLPSANDFSIAIPMVRISITSTTTMYLIAQVGFSAGSVTAYGMICARRASR